MSKESLKKKKKKKGGQVTVDLICNSAGMPVCQYVSSQ